MFWNRKKDAAKKAGAPPAPPLSAGKAQSVHAASAAGSSGSPGSPHAQGSGSSGSPAGPSSVQFLTGDSDLDRRSVEVLLEAIARVSEARNLDELLLDIVDRSIEIVGAERGLLILADEDAR